MQTAYQEEISESFPGKERITRRLSLLSRVTLDALKTTANNRTSPKRGKALLALAALQDEMPQQEIIKSLKDHDQTIRLKALDALENFTSDAGAQHLTPLLNDMNPAVRRRALEVITKLKTPLDVKQSLALASDFSVPVRKALITYLSEVQPAYTEVIVDVLSHDQKQSVIRALETVLDY